MRRDAQHVLLLLLGGALVRIAADDTYLRYVRPSHRWWLLATGAVVIGLAAVALVRDLRGMVPADGHAHCAPHSTWLLLLPVLVIVLVAPPALGADAVDRGRGIALPSIGTYPPLPPGPLVLDIGEVVERSAWDEARSLDDREVILTGFVVRRGPDTLLARLTIACCAADARPNVVRLLGPVGDRPPDTWLRVRGTVVAGSATRANRYTPSLIVEDVTVVPAPSDPYEH
ncbi:TIGR03943 family putative permease subunit [Pseudonocardia asaccharolytica]|uniref:TIGR03943 family protein n=1 Tax=Pseudonocardia asaccharolytica DSM 44247 = NBRC 16224 TaxID=1123024 RepID=A0A511D887_9PSEU|nr:TIGR03943 family protein [Pseudonocardia asaccharolytica]GEL21015.1 TIGR03943 family protein [Pseudonocardia asaccharolytica DSM 44247 = NBRC 16224]